MEVVTELGRNGYTLKAGHAFPEAFINDIKKDLSVAPKDNGYNLPRIFRVYYERTNGDLVMPRYYALKKLGKPNNNLFKRRSNTDFTNVKFNGKLRQAQVEPASAILNALGNIGGGILSLQTGGGKTAIAIFCINKLKARTIVIVNRVELVKQWKRELARFLPFAHIGELRGDIDTSKDAHVVVAMINTISMKDFKADFFGNFDLLVLDECHCMASEIFSSAMPKIRTPWTIGLSATPERRDGLMKVVEYFMGDIVYKSDSKINSKKDVIVRFIKYKGPREFSAERLSANGKPNTSLMLTMIGDNPDRTTLIINQIIEITKDKRRHILVLADRKKLLKNLHKKLTELDISCGLFIGEMKEEEYVQSKTKQVVLGSYQICGTGFNLPSLNTLIMATPRSAIEQMVGRILRQEHEIEPLVIDIADMFSLYVYMAKKRMKFYDEQKEIKVQEINTLDLLS